MDVDMDELCPHCGANIGIGTYEILGCPLCEEEDYDDEIEEEEE